MPESRSDLSLRAVNLCIIAALLVGFSPVSLPIPPDVEMRPRPPTHAAIDYPNSPERLPTILTLSST